jgi:hypothetical protein
MRKYPGGGWPQRVDQLIPKIAKERGVEKPEYIQLTGKTDVIALLRLAVKTSRMPSITCSFSPTGRYGGARIAHMVSLVHAGDGG